MTKNAICYYPGIFNPPTAGHLQTAIWLNNKPEVSQVVVVVGKDAENGLSPEQKYKLWDLFLRSLSTFNISIEKADTSPLTAIYKKFENSQEAPFYIAVDENTARDEDFLLHFQVFPNYDVILTSSDFEKESEEMRNAAHENDLRKLSDYLPAQFDKSVRTKAMEIINDGKQRTEDFKKAIQEKFDPNWISSIL